MDRETSVDANLRLNASPGQFFHPSLTAYDREKATEILQACRAHDLDTLISLATSKSGLVEDEVRRTACMCCRQDFWV